MSNEEYKQSKDNISAFHNHCCGCAQCVNVCPVQAITMTFNYQGFLFPLVDNEKCIHCKKCIKECSFNNQSTHSMPYEQEAYAVKHIDEEVRRESRSGGFFTAATDYVLENDGVVYGCELINSRTAIHKRATNKKERDYFRGSKYIQSDITDCYKSIRDDLESGKLTLFSGTPCQVDAIASYCNDSNQSNLLLIDIVCYGTPSQKVWEDYLNYLTKKGRKVVQAVFRNKRQYGWAAHIETIKFDDGSLYSGDIFKTLFSNLYILRDSCFTCPYKNLKRFGDITIADCWGIAQNRPDFDDNKGISLIIINTEKGKKLFQRCLHSLEIIPINIENYMQPCLKENWEKPKDYDEFWKYYGKHAFGAVIKKYVKKTEKKPIRVFANRCFHYVLRKIRGER